MSKASSSENTMDNGPISESLGFIPLPEHVIVYQSAKKKPRTKRQILIITPVSAIIENFKTADQTTLTQLFGQKYVKSDENTTDEDFECKRKKKGNYTRTRRLYNSPKEGKRKINGASKVLRTI